MTQNPAQPLSDLADGRAIHRRDFINVAAVSAASVGGLCALVPLISQMAPSADVLASGAPKSVDISALTPGQQIVVNWRSMPIFIVRRTPQELATLQQPSLLSRLRDPDSQAAQQPDYARNWHRSINPEYLVLIGICTHLGCIPGYQPEKGAEGSDWPGGYFCPCHGSKYDLAGRVFNGVPAPFNLPVPPYNFANATTLTIGANPPGSNFDVSAIGQM